MSNTILHFSIVHFTTMLLSSIEIEIYEPQENGVTLLHSQNIYFDPKTDVPDSRDLDV